MPAPPVDLALERLRRLPQHPGDVFELAIIRMPAWIVPEGEEPFRPLLSVAHSREMKKVGEHLIDPRDGDEIHLLEAIAKLAVVAGAVGSNASRIFGGGSRRTRARISAVCRARGSGLVTIESKSSFKVRRPRAACVVFRRPSGVSGRSASAIPELPRATAAPWRKNPAITGVLPR